MAEEKQKSRQASLTLQVMNWKADVPQNASSAKTAAISDMLPTATGRCRTGRGLSPDTPVLLSGMTVCSA